MLGQNFSKQFGLTFQSEEGKDEFAWNTSWGVSTRLIGGMIMTHGDDTGAVVPPRLAPTQVMILPIFRGDDEKVAVMEKAEAVRNELLEAGIRVKVDAREHLRPGPKFWEWERKGVPYRIEIGPKDLAKGQLALAKRVRGEDEPRKEFLPEAQAVAEIPGRLEAMQGDLLETARARREANSHRGITSIGELNEILESGGGFVYSGWSGDPAVEEQVKAETKATIRVIPDPEFRSESTPEKCISGAESKMEVVWARAY